MTITPFLTLKIRGKKDALLARQKARRVANLLGFDSQEQTCVAAGVFVVACQALILFGKARLCFQIENHHLQVFAQESMPKNAESANPRGNRITGMLREVDPQSLYRLTKPLPAEKANDLAELDVGWLVNKVEETAPNGLFDEIVKQNQEILALLSELRLCQANPKKKEDNSRNPHAA